MLILETPITTAADGILVYIFIIRENKALASVGLCGLEEGSGAYVVLQLHSHNMK